MSKKIAVSYSFRMRYEQTVRTVLVPAEQLFGEPLGVETVRSVVDNDPALMKGLFGEYLAEYTSMTARPGIWSKDLQRFDEKIVLVEVVHAG